MSDLKPFAYTKYLGVKRPIIVSEDPNMKKGTITFQDQALMYVGKKIDKESVEKAVITFYKREAKRIITNRINAHMPKIRIKPRSVTIDGDNTKWGTCNGNRDLTFHWMLVMYPMEAIDYVVVHELCHLKHLNHDRSFWRLVGKIMPNYKDAQKMIHDV